LPISSNQLKIISIIPTIVGIYGIAIYILTNSPIFLITSVVNLCIAAFFWYKYLDKNKQVPYKKGKKP
jgi:C4-dicarboxylate transporter